MEDFYAQGRERLRRLKNYAEKLSERFIDLKSVIEEKCTKIEEQWNELEERFLTSINDDFDQLERGLVRKASVERRSIRPSRLDLQNEFVAFEEWLGQKSEDLWNLRCASSPNDRIDRFNELMVTKTDRKERPFFLSSDFTKRNSVENELRFVTEGNLRTVEDRPDRSSLGPCARSGESMASTVARIS